MIDKRRLDLPILMVISGFNTIFEIFWPFSLALSALKVENREICEVQGTYFLNCESMSDLTNVPASIYDRKSAA